MAEATTPAPACGRLAAPDATGRKGPWHQPLCPSVPRRLPSTIRAHASTAAIASTI
jgi:hypothetical protein